MNTPILDPALLYDEYIKSFEKSFYDFYDKNIGIACDYINKNNSPENESNKKYMSLYYAKLQIHNPNHGYLKEIL